MRGGIYCERVEDPIWGREERGEKRVRRGAFAAGSLMGRWFALCHPTVFVSFEAGKPSKSRRFRIQQR